MNGLRRATVSTLVAASLVLTGYTAGTLAAQTPTVEQAVAQTAERPRLVGDQVCTTGPIHQAIYGDSITSFRPAYANNWKQSWVYWASSNAYPATHGWAYPGATLAQMAAHATNSNAKVVQIMGGTNDLPIMALGKPGTPKVQMLASIDQIVAIESPEVVVILAVPPFGWNYHESNVWNQQLREHAALRGWEFFDPWVGLRDPNGAWWPGTSNDLVHPGPAYTWHPGGLVYSHLLGM